MRALAYCVLTSLISLPAFAQAPVGAPARAAAAAGATMTTTAAPNAAKTTAADAVEEKQEIGFDPKVKRDPSGKPIGAPATQPARTSEIDKLRKDTSSTMRSDRQLIKSPVSSAPPAPPTAPPMDKGMPKEGENKNNPETIQKSVIRGGVVRPLN